jgi:hypothetical protein
MSSSEISNDQPPRTMRPVAILFFMAVFCVSALLAATASFAVSPLAAGDDQISER